MKFNYTNGIFAAAFLLVTLPTGCACGCGGPSAFSIGGTITGLTGTVVLQNNDFDDLTLTSNGTFAFAYGLANGHAYNVTILTQPALQTCTVANGSGSATADVSNVAVTCASQVGGAMQGVPLNLTPTVGTLAVNAQLGAVTFNAPMSVTTDGTNLYVADMFNNKIRQIAIATGVASTLAGTGSPGVADGPGATARFNSPVGITTDGINVYVLDNNKIRKIVIATGEVSSLTGVADTPGATGFKDGAGWTATFFMPYGITTDGTNLYVADTNNNKIRKIVIATGEVSSVTGATDMQGTPSAADGAGSLATFDHPYGITTDGTNLYVADTSNHKIRKIVIATGEVSSVTGAANTQGTPNAADGAGATATYNFPCGITTDGTDLYVADRDNNKIRKIVIATGEVSSVTGAANTPSTPNAVDGAGSWATFNLPYGITTDGSNLYVADAGNNSIRKIQ